MQRLDVRERHSPVEKIKKNFSKSIQVLWTEHFYRSFKFNDFKKSAFHTRPPGSCECITTFVTRDRCRSDKHPNTKFHFDPQSLRSFRASICMGFICRTIQYGEEWSKWSLLGMPRMKDTAVSLWTAGAGDRYTSEAAKSGEFQNRTHANIELSLNVCNALCTQCAH